MVALKKNLAGLMVCAFWAVNIALLMIESKKVGYYPPSVRFAAQEAANRMPYPWNDIFIGWGIVSLFSIGLYLIISRTKNKITNTLWYSILLSFLPIMFTGSDVGGVYGGLVLYGFSLFFLTLAYLIFRLIYNRLSCEKTL